VPFASALEASTLDASTLDASTLDASTLDASTGMLHSVISVVRISAPEVGMIIVLP
jgi:hypothetical protein